MFEWNGTNITDILLKCNIYSATFNKITYWMINTDEDKTYICRSRSSVSNFACLIDEIKEIFGLSKIGTHWCVIRNKTYILTKCLFSDNGCVKEDIHLNELKEEDITDILKLQVQEIFTFRKLLGVTCTYDSSIIVRKGTCGYYPISFYEPNMKMENDKTIPGTVLKKWFSDTTIDEVVKRICKIQKLDQITDVVFRIGYKLEEIIERVDRKSINHKNYILERITQRLQTTLVMH